MPTRKKRTRKVSPPPVEKPLPKPVITKADVWLFQPGKSLDEMFAYQERVVTALKTYWNYAGYPATIARLLFVLKKYAGLTVSSSHLEIILPEIAFPESAFGWRLKGT